MIRTLIRRSLERLGYRLTRTSSANRFDAMAASLAALSHRGYAPRTVIDVGANRGQWTRLARPIFPTAEFVLLEPQPSCAEALKELVRQLGNARFESIAVTEPGIESVRMIGADAGSTGAWVAEKVDHGDGELHLPATTLDALLADALEPAQRTLLKLDVERHEMAILRGAQRLLPKVEVVLLEAQLFAINDNGRPLFSDLLELLRTAGFELYDFATLSGRQRDGRLRMVDALLVRRDSPLLADRSWE